MQVSHVAVGAFFVVGTFAACSDTTSGSGPVSVAGSVAGQSFPLASGYATVGPMPSTPHGRQIEIDLTNRADTTCASTQRAISGLAANHPNEDLLSLSVYNPSGDVVTGSYDFQDTANALAGAFFLATTSACLPADGILGASGGTVTLTQIDATRVTGTFDVRFGSKGDAFSGSFDTEVCNFSYPADAGTGPIVCTP